MSNLTRELILEITGYDIDPRFMSKKDKKAMEELIEVTQALKRDYEEAKRVNPFWYYEPSDGTVSEDGYRLMQDYLRPDDIPPAGGLDSQLDVHTSTASIIGAFGGNQGGKGLVGGESVLTPEGFVKIRDIRLGDTVFSDDGNPVVVEGVFDRGEQDTFEFFFDDGSRLTVDRDHIWKCKNRNRRFARNDRPNRVYGEWTTLTTEEILRFYPVSGFPRKARDKIAIPTTAPVKMPARAVEIAPYAMGALLGDGGFSGRGVRFSSVDDPVLEKLRLCGLSLSKVKGDGCDWYVQGLQAELRRLGLMGRKSETKFIPDEYLYNCAETRLEVLRGLMDTDGYVKPHKDVIFYSTSKRLAKGVRQLVESLGGKARMSVKETSCDGNPCKPCHVVRITYIPVNPFFLPRKAEMFKGFARTSDRILQKIIPRGRQRTYCIKVSGGRGMFLATRHIATHNTTTGAIEAFIKVTGKVPYAMKDVYPKEKLRESIWNRGEPVHVRVVGVDYQTFKMNLLPTYEKWAPREFLPDGEFWKGYSSEDRILTLVADKKLIGTIEFKTNEQKVESFQGPPRHKIIYDEEPRYDIHKENLMRFTTAARLDILFNMTPTRGLSWVHDEIVLKQDRKDIACFKIPSITNKRANLEVLREILDGMTTYEEVKMRLLGEFVSLSGLVYGNLFNEKLHLIEPFPINPDDFIVYRGLDPHLVKPSACLELAMDREENEYVCGAYLKDVDTDTLKQDLAERARQRNYRLGWTQCDKSADSTIKILNERNVFRELGTGRYAVPALFKSDKFVGSIHAGVDTIKRRLKPDPVTGKPTLVFFNIPEMDQLISAMKTMERDRGLREEDTGKVDKIKEGKWDLHACLRYMHQRKMRWLPREQPVPEYVPENDAIGY